jgi:hypothetical protein
VQVQPLVELPGQVGVLTVTTSDGAEQLQLKGMVLAPPLTVMVALAGQDISGMVTVADAD